VRFSFVRNCSRQIYVMVDFGFRSKMFGPSLHSFTQDLVVDRSSTSTPACLNCAQRYHGTEAAAEPEPQLDKCPRRHTP
jgi:hypothetical protein